MVCGKSLKCGTHQCKQVCHDGECSEVCAETCGKLLLCSHYCQQKCHYGSVCEGECRHPVLWKCKCGFAKVEGTCSQPLSVDCSPICAVEQRNRNFKEALNIQDRPQQRVEYEEDILALASEDMINTKKMEKIFAEFVSTR